jgi:hypothetical protein
MASLLFLLFGLWILFDGALRWPGVAIGVTATVGVAAIAVAIVRWLIRRRTSAAPPPLPDAQPESASGT